MKSLYTLLLAYENNKDLIKAYLSNKSIENWSDTNKIELDKAQLKTSANILGFTVGIFISIFLISLITWIWAVVILVKYWSQLPGWAKVLGVIGVLPIIPVGQILTIIVVYISKGPKKLVMPSNVMPSNVMPSKI